MASRNPVHKAGEVRFGVRSSFQLNCWHHCVLQYIESLPWFALDCGSAARGTSSRCSIKYRNLLQGEFPSAVLQVQALKMELDLSAATSRDLMTLLRREKREHQKVPELGALYYGHVPSALYAVVLLKSKSRGTQCRGAYVACLTCRCSTTTGHWSTSMSFCSRSTPQSLIKQRLPLRAHRSCSSGCPRWTRTCQGSGWSLRGTRRRGGSVRRTTAVCAKYVLPLLHQQLYPPHVPSCSWPPTNRAECPSLEIPAP